MPSITQLNMYGFHKQRQHLNYHYFAHQLFRKGALEEGFNSKTQIEIKRKPEKKKNLQHASLAETNFNPQNNEELRSQECLSNDFESHPYSVSIDLNEDK